MIVFESLNPGMPEVFTSSCLQEVGFLSLATRRILINNNHGRSQMSLSGVLHKSLKTHEREGKNSPEEGKRKRLDNS